MSDKWTQPSGYNAAARLGQLAIKAQGLIVAQRARTVQRMMDAHARDLLKLPDGAQKLEAARAEIAKMAQLIKEISDGE